jgi:hypothetical protein
LYAGGEFGIYVSFDDGQNWQTLQLNLPVTPVTDLAVHRKDLVVATQGRSFWILDDLSPLHQMTDEVSKAPAHLFEPRDAHRVRLGGPRGGSVPENPPQGAVFFYHFAEAPQGEVTLEILDAENQPVRRYSSKPSSRKPPKPRFGMPMDLKVSAKPGMNRFVWDLNYPGPVLGDDALMYLGYSGGPTAVPGKYQVRIRHRDWSETRTFQILKDPRIQTTQAEYQEQFDLLLQVRDKLTETHDALRTIREVREQVDKLTEKMIATDMGEGVEEAAKKVLEKLAAIEGKLIQTKNEAHQDPINFPPQLDTRFGFLYGYVHRLNGKPTEGAYKRFEDLKPLLATERSRLQVVLDTELAGFVSLLRQKGASPIILEN